MNGAVGSDGAVDAPVLQPGQYVDTLGGDQEESGVKYYRVPHRPGAVPHISVIGRPAEPGQNDKIQTSITTPEGDRCTFGDSGSTVAWLQQNPVLASSLVFYPWQGAYAEQCEQSDHLVVEVRRGVEGMDQAPDTGEIPIEIQVISEPEVLNTDELPSMVEQSDLVPDPATEQRSAGKVAGGTTFSEAARIEPGTWTDTAQTGEMLFYRVDAGWGQQPTLTVRLPDDPSLGLGNLDGIPIALTAYAPDRTPINLASTDNQTEVLYAGEQAELSITLPEVRYRNREDVSSSGPAVGPVGSTSLAGDYYFALQVQYPRDGERHQLDTRISANVAGEVSGVPAYAGGVDPMAIPTPAADDEAPASTDDAEQRRAGRSGPAQGGDNAASAAGSGRDGSVWLALGGAVGVVVIGGLAVAILLRSSGRNVS